jgi:putative ABC transport system ATP-binding protein
MENLICLRNIVKKYYIGSENELEVLHGIDLDIREGEFTSIVGESGSGKSTLMNIIGLLDRPTEGTYEMKGIDVDGLSDDELSDVRNRQIGFVFQTYNLIPRMSALANVEVPMLYARIPRKEREEKAQHLLEMVGMQDRMMHRPDELSGGQKQRVAIARAIANNPSLLLADEPTGALDSKTGQRIMDIFHRLHEEQHKTILLITHSQPLAEETERILTLKDGQIVGERVGSGSAGSADAEKAKISAKGVSAEDVPAAEKGDSSHKKAASFHAEHLGADKTEDAEDGIVFLELDDKGKMREEEAGHAD